MALVLSSENLISYLEKRSLCSPDKQLVASIKLEEYRNFNLIVNFVDNKHYIVKQERFDGQGKATGCLKYEWILQQLVDSFPQLTPIKVSIAPMIDFDPENAILVAKYLPEYVSLSELYDRLNDYPPNIAASVASNLAQIHRLTFNNKQYLDFLTQYDRDRNYQAKPNLLRGLARVGPGLFGNICSGGIKFFQLYQRFPSLHQAMAELYENHQAVCLTHDDPRLSNFLIKDQDLATDPQIKLIDWEFMAWGDPAQDLGILISKYLELWLGSLLISSDIDLNLALSLASCPLTKIQPSLTAILQNYLTAFPEITSVRPDFVRRVIQFAGLSLIKHLQHRIEYHQPFGNDDICTLQVAKSLLCYPDQSISNIFGLQNAEILLTA
jgi:Phosphotransferase enzyme family